jgi:hypothetical protein
MRSSRCTTWCSLRTYGARFVDSRDPVAGEPRPTYTLLLASGVVSLAGGRVIAERTQGKYQITRLTSFGDTSTRLGKPRAVTFASGQRTVEVGGWFAELGADGHIVVASAGDRLRAAIKGFPAGTLWVRVSRRGTTSRFSWRRQRGQRVGSAARWRRGVSDRSGSSRAVLRAAGDQSPVVAVPQSATSSVSPAPQHFRFHALESRRKDSSMTVSLSMRRIRRGPQGVQFVIGPARLRSGH